MRGIDDWSYFINIHRIARVNQYLFVQSDRLRLLTCITMFSGRYRNCRFRIGSSCHHAPDSINRQWSEDHPDCQSNWWGCTLHLPMVLGWYMQHTRLVCGIINLQRFTRYDYHILLQGDRLSEFSLVTMFSWRCCHCKPNTLGRSTEPIVPDDRRWPKSSVNIARVRWHGSPLLPMVFGWLL